MEKKYFNEKDTEKLVSLLNFIATNAEFNRLKVQDILAFTKLLNWCQVELLPKIEANIFEVKEIKQQKKESK